MGIPYRFNDVGNRSKILGERHAHYLQEQLDHGGLLLWVRTRDAAHEARAIKILNRHSGRDVHVHTIPVDD